jgi:hypothetical protein
MNPPMRPPKRLSPAYPITRFLSTVMGCVGGLLFALWIIKEFLR